MEFRILHFYPDLMNLYGSYANVSVLVRLLERMGHTVTVETVSPMDGETTSEETASGKMASGKTASGGPATSKSGTTPPDLSHADFLYMGAGTERRQRFAMRDFARYGEAVKAAAGDGLPMLFAGTAMELLGESVTTAEGETFAGVGLAGFTTVQGRRRIVGDVYGHSALFSQPLVGFMNKCGVIHGVETPLCESLDLGFGNEAEKGPEGFRQGNVLASELTGPLLVKNPRLLETVAAAMLTRRGAAPASSFPLDEWAEKGYAVTQQALQARTE